MTNYAVYNTQEECVCVGTAKECAKYLEVSKESIKSYYYRTKNHKHNSIYDVYKVEESEDE